MIIRTSHKKDFILIWSVAVILFLTVNFIGTSIMAEFNALLPVYLIIFIVSALFTLISIIKHRNSYLQLNEKEIVQHKGVFNLSTISVSYDKIDNIRTKRELINRILGLVDLEIDTPGDKGVEIIAKDLPYSKSEIFYAELKEKMENAKKGMNKNEE